MRQRRPGPPHGPSIPKNHLGCEIVAPALGIPGNTSPQGAFRSSAASLRASDAAPDRER